MSGKSSKCELNVINKITQENDILSARYSNDGNEIFAGSINGEICRYESRTLKLLSAYTDDDMSGNNNPVTSVTPLVQSSEKFLTSHANGWVKVWDIQSGNCVLTIRERAQIMAVVPHPKRDRLVTLSEDARIRLYDSNSGQLTMTFENSYTKEKMTGHDSKIFAAKFHPKQINEFISGGWDDTVQFWDMRKQNSIRYFAGAHICGDGLDIDPAGDMVLTCAYQANNSCRIWSYNTAKLYMDISTETSRLYCGKYIGQKFLMTGGSDPCLVRIINLFTFGTLATYKSPQLGVYSLDSFRRGEKKDTILNHKIIMASGNVLTELEVRYTYTIS
ncbi:dynein assembly factor with WDR repeat domains 1-like [Cimex lectularius]|uniref:Uncharacterized protein n=1 Tax=Cimex lectularius TaxID=79782 RepID=A0A8I6RAK8_CIMLE|nr:dynein assembly factor with WDR repeat domains 1-like [Cimex lectularius]